MNSERSFLSITQSSILAWMLRPEEVWTKDNNLQYRTRGKADDEAVHSELKQEQQQGPRK